MKNWNVLLESRVQRKLQARFGGGYSEKGSNVPRRMPTLHEFDERHRIVDAPVDRATSASPAENGTEQRSAPAASAKPAMSSVGSGRVKAVSNGHQQLVDEVDPRSPVTDQQWSSIRKLCQHLGKAEPQATDTMNYLAAKELIAQLTQEYRQSRSKAS